MAVKAVLLGSIGVLAETSDIQRRAYNRALSEAGVKWQWDVSTYQRLLTEPGGRSRLSRLSSERDFDLSAADIERIHARKTELACDEVRATPVGLRPGIAALIETAIARHLALALVTTTYRANIDSIADAAGDALPLHEFGAVLTVADAPRPKPAPDIYQVALERLQVDPGEAIAFEDSAASVRSARAAGIFTVAVPGEYTAAQDFAEANVVVDSLEGYELPESLAQQK